MRYAESKQWLRPASGCVALADVLCSEGRMAGGVGLRLHMLQVAVVDGRVEVLPLDGGGPAGRRLAFARVLVRVARVEHLAWELQTNPLRADERVSES